MRPPLSRPLTVHLDAQALATGLDEPDDRVAGGARHVPVVEAGYEVARSEAAASRLLAGVHFAHRARAVSRHREAERGEKRGRLST